MYYPEDSDKEISLLKPEYELAKLIRNNLDITVEPKLLRLFIALHWEKIRMHAHAIHRELA